MTLGVIYVSSNKEDPIFEKKTREDLLFKIGNLPIVSVTQKPVDLGKNICVGEIGASGFNFCRQVQLACANIDTDFVISAESDCLYPKEYFEFVPERLDIPYRNRNIYVQKYHTNYFCKKDSSTFAQVVGRKFYLERLNDLFIGQPLWSTELKNFPKEIGKKLFNEFEYFETKVPCISFKTGKGMRKHSNTDEVPTIFLEGWGETAEVIRKYQKE